MKTVSLVAFMVASNFAVAQSVIKEANKDVLRPTYNPPASISNSARITQDRNHSPSQSWWPDFYRSFQSSVSSTNTEKKSAVSHK